ncbi:hypothetical protein TRFO_28008 [Tritrichomonas foetus]|uniref:Deoxyhypusine synthase n=1 Tax=Tritrichomonas foetus TaxID=1144522 RepID=A0A1J4K0L1_9EUKA|nr:hypothetical protein TRFO_28008 [Tritrichomonas foetus]|eukprot:OHT04498.1 hypothetical protein TRFO_28008 [Tritrichomonas foetus]
MFLIHLFLAQSSTGSFFLVHILLMKEPILIWIIENLFFFSFELFKNLYLFFIDETNITDRIGNLIVPNSNYCKFENWIMPILDKMVEEQKTQRAHWTPSQVIKRLGQEINNEDSVWYWCAKNDIPVYSPAITDGSIGDMIYFHSYKTPGLVIDIVEDIKNMNNEAIWAKKTGTIILGGGVIKHHIMNANLFRNGADFSVYINTSSEFDGSDSGARPDEAVSWGKISPDAKPVKLYAEVTLVLPIIVATTFAKFIRGE